MVNQKSSLAKDLDNIHKDMLNDSTRHQDVILAQKLEIFLNKVYGYKNINFSSNPSMSDAINNLLSQETAETISKNLNIPSKPVNWKQFERDIAAIFGELAKKIVEDGETKVISQNLHVGTVGSYVDLGEIPERYRDRVMQAFGKQITKKGMSEGISRTYVKQQKNDVIFVEGSLQDDIQQEFEIFKNLGASIKDYKDPNSSIKLEKVNPLKAYAAILSHYSNLIQSMITNPYVLYFKYYGKPPKIKDNPRVTDHLNHLLSIYGLTGIGAKDAGTKQATQSTRFLIIRNSEQIKVKSTKEMIQELLNNNSEKYLFGSSKSKSAKYSTQTVKVR